LSLLPVCKFSLLDRQKEPSHYVGKKKGKKKKKGGVGKGSEGDNPINDRRQLSSGMSFVLYLSCAAAAFTLCEQAQRARDLGGKGKKRRKKKKKEKIARVMPKRRSISNDFADYYPPLLTLYYAWVRTA